MKKQEFFDIIALIKEYRIFRYLEQGGTLFNEADIDDMYKKLQLEISQNIKTQKIK